jgi:hypothetical protein
MGLNRREICLLKKAEKIGFKIARGIPEIGKR